MVTKKRIFLRNSESGEPAALCGDADDMPGVLKAIGHFLEADLPESLAANDENIDYQIEIKSMTDEEVAALPDM